MPKYMIAASYTAEGLEGLQKDKASDRRSAVDKVLESLGGKVEAMYFARGDHDVILIADLPDTVSATALARGVSASGLVATETTALLAVQETDQALQKKVDFRQGRPMSESKSAGSQGLQQLIFDSLTDSRFTWRTANGISRDTGLDAKKVVTFLENSPQILRASTANTSGQALYSLRDRHGRETPLIDKVISVIQNSTE